jgi:hypothetical protein
MLAEVSEFRRLRRGRRRRPSLTSYARALARSGRDGIPQGPSLNLEDMNASRPVVATAMHLHRHRFAVRVRIVRHEDACTFATTGRDPSSACACSCSSSCSGYAASSAANHVQHRRRLQHRGPQSARTLRRGAGSWWSADDTRWLVRVLRRQLRAASVEPGHLEADLRYQARLHARPDDCAVRARHRPGGRVARALRRSDVRVQRERPPLPFPLVRSDSLPHCQRLLVRREPRDARDPATRAPERPQVPRLPRRRARAGLREGAVHARRTHLLTR